MANGRSDAAVRPSPAVADESALAGVGDGQLLGRFTAERDELAEIAFAALVRRHGPMVLRVCRQIVGDSHAAEDAFQAAFLILARRAPSIRQPDLLANWLYGVALRTAREARVREERHRHRETPVPGVDPAEPASQASPPETIAVIREELQALHEEVARLPERYRVPVVLCELEGLTYQEAAIRLRCPVGTIGVRLKRARQQLRVRLTRRGLAPTAGLFAAILAGRAVAGVVPAPLAASTIEAAVAFAAGEARAAGIVALSVVGLAEGVLKTMAVSPLSIAAGVLLAVGLGGGLGWLVWHRPMAAPPRVRDAVRVNRPASEGAAGGRRQAAPIVAQEQPAAPGRVVPVALNVPASAAPTAKNGTPASASVRRSKPSPLAAPLQVREERDHGAMLFAKEWVPGDPMSRGGDGLGPLFNESSCVACHGMGAPGGAGPEAKNVVLLSGSATTKEAAAKLENIHPGFRGTSSIVLHRFSTEPDYQAWKQRFDSRQPGQRRQNGGPQNAGQPTDAVAGRMQALRQQSVRPAGRRARLIGGGDVALQLSERNAPALFGAGKIDALPVSVLTDAANAQLQDVRGRVNRTPNGAVGRFGWKAQIATLHEFVRAACANELGLEVPDHSQPLSPLAKSRKAPGLDMSESDCDALVSYVRDLPAPVAIDPAGPQGSPTLREGRKLFATVGCADCHVPTLGQVRGIYSDLLLHDMGSSLSDSGTYYGFGSPSSPGDSSPNGPGPTEWRTPPLWGFRDSAPYLHDGRAETLAEAVAFHEGQGSAAAYQFFLRTEAEQAKIESFLKSLVAPAAAASPGVVLAADLESQVEREERSSPEALLRRRQEEIREREEQQWKTLQEMHRIEAEVKRADALLTIARNFEKSGQTRNALEFYRDVVRRAPASKPGREAAARIAAIRRTAELETLIRTGSRKGSAG